MDKEYSQGLSILYGINLTLKTPAIKSVMALKAPIPFAENPWLTGLPSPYYNESHYKWQATCREFIDGILTPFAKDFEKDKQLPDHVFKAFAEQHFIIAGLPAPLPVNILKGIGITHLPGGLAVEEFDYFHHLVYNTEVSFND